MGIHWGATAEDWHSGPTSVSLVANSDPLLLSAGTAALHAADQPNKSRAAAAEPKIGLCIYVSVYGGLNVWRSCEAINPPPHNVSAKELG